ncbi:hypothetical protein [Flagellimonas sp. 2504JD4-2]
MIRKKLLNFLIFSTSLAMVSQTHTTASIENDLYVNYNTYSSGSTGDGKGNLILFGDGANGAGWQSSVKWSGRDGFNSSTSSGTRVNAEIGIANVGTYGKADLVFKTKGSNDNATPTEKLRISQNGNIGLRITAPNSQFVVTSNFGANISGSTGGNAVYGSNMAVVQGGTNHNKLITPSSHNGNYGYSGMRASWGKLYFYAKNGNTTQDQLITDAARMFIDSYGKVGIGTENPDSKLTVKGNIHAEEIKVDLSVPGPDYVFKEDYDLKSLEEVQNYIKKHGHLPNIPSAQEMEANGIELGEMNMRLLEKIEELVLYTLEQEKRIEKLEISNQRISLLEKTVEQLLKDKE